VIGPARFVGASLDWFHYALPTAGQGFWKGWNLSLSFAGLRLAETLGWEYQPGPLPAMARLYLATAGFGAPLLAGWLTRRRDDRVQLAAVIVACVAFSPVWWVNNVFPVLLLPAALVAERAGRGHGSRTGKNHGRASHVLSVECRGEAPDSPLAEADEDDSPP
jgi:hypothetical protein